MILTLTGASGAGKTTIAKELLVIMPVVTQMVPSHTTHTRKPRATDLPGEYIYVSKFRFWLTEKLGLFLWTVHPHGNSYGTTKRWVAKALRNDGELYLMILVGDIMKILREFANQKSCLNQIFSFYVISPSQKILRERLELRGDGPDDISKRLSDCVKWDSDATNSGVPYEFVRNDSAIEEAVVEIKNRFLTKLGSCDCYF